MKWGVSAQAHAVLSGGVTCGGGGGAGRPGQLRPAVGGVGGKCARLLVCSRGVARGGALCAGSGARGPERTGSGRRLAVAAESPDRTPRGGGGGTGGTGIGGDSG